MPSNKPPDTIKVKRPTSQILQYVDLSEFKEETSIDLDNEKHRTSAAMDIEMPRMPGKGSIRIRMHSGSKPASI